MPEDIQAALIDHAIAEKRFMYSDLMESWKALDGKAQAAATVSGIFLAAITALAKDDAIQGSVQQGLIILALAFLVAAIVLAVWVMRLRNIIAPPAYDEDSVLSALIKTDKALSKEDQKEFLSEQLGYWDQTCKSCLEHIQTKSSLLTISHVLVVLAAMFIAYLVTERVLG